MSSLDDERPFLKLHSVSLELFVHCDFKLLLFTLGLVDFKFILTDCIF